MANVKALGIDVSSHQGKINWDKVKASGIKYAILRCGYGSDMKKQDDSQFARNLAECERVGMPKGIYLFSYANTAEKARSEARHVLRLIEGHKFEYPIYYDLEDSGTTGACSNVKILNIAKAFTEILEKAGYWVGIYSSKYWFTNKLTDPWYDTKAKWVAQYNKTCTYKGPYQMWQYCSDGKVNGISGNTVDMNYCYVDYPTMIKEAGLNGYKKTTTAGRPAASTKPTTESTKPAKPTTTKPSTSTKPTTTTKPATTPKKSIDEIAQEVIDGKWGNGETRKKKLKAAGYDYDKVQDKVNDLIRLRKGGKITLKGAKYYANASTTSPVKTIFGKVKTLTGTYYIYDGECINGRYRVTNKLANCGKTPIGRYVTGYVNKSDIK